MGGWIETVLVSSITGILTYFLGRRRERKELDGLTLSNLEKSVSIYQTIIEDLKDEVKQLNDKIDILEKKVESLLQENEELKKLMKQHDKNLS
jgi:peptidoglycan hydrolase CwlO-like protein